MPNFDFEKQYTGLIAGTDEAGRGPWVGPVVAAAVVWPNYQIPDVLRLELDDSKKLSSKKREKLFDLILQSNAIWGIGSASAEEIDEINILQASFLAMRRALNIIEEKGCMPDRVLIDGNRLPKDWKWQTSCLIGGDAKSLSIAAASILAKVTRDRILTKLAEEYPAYGWDKNAGYGTAQHIQALQQFGVTPYHRKSYKPVAALLSPQT